MRRTTQGLLAASGSVFRAAAGTGKWEVETFFNDVTATIRSEQWHSKTYNDTMQEHYALMWLINATDKAYELK